MKTSLKLLSITIVVTVLILVGLVSLTRVMTAEAPEMTWSEYQEYISMLNYEIEKMGGSVTLQNISGENGFINAMHAKVRSRAVEASDGRVMGKPFTSSEYAIKRESLMKKAEL